MENSKTIAVDIAGDDKTQVVVYKHPSVKAYQCRVKFHGQPWKSQTTKHKNLDAAIEAAKNIYYQMKGKLEAGGQIHITRFRDLAIQYLTERQREIDRSTHKRGSASIKEYRSVINTYLIPFFGDMDVNRINREAILDYREWRHTYWTEGPGAKRKFIEYERGGKTIKRPITDRSGPSERRIQIEDTILKGIFNYGMELEKVTKLPPLKTPKAQRNSRPAIEPKHLEAMLGRIYNRALEAPNDHLFYQRRVFEVFFKICLLTGIRPGKETASLKWKHFLNDGSQFYLRPENAKRRLTDKPRRNVVPMKELLGFLVHWRMKSKFDDDEDCQHRSKNTPYPGIKRDQSALNDNRVMAA